MSWKLCFPRLQWLRRFHLTHGRKLTPRVAKRSFGDKCIPNQEIGNERKNRLPELAASVVSASGESAKQTHSNLTPLTTCKNNQNLNRNEYKSRVLRLLHQTQSDMNAEYLKPISLPASHLSCSFAIDPEGTVVFATFSGFYGNGSAGNGDGLYMFSMLAAHYLIFESICVVLDLRGLEYHWGNTILKTINFFHELGRDSDEKAKRVIIVTSEKNREALESLEKSVTGGNRTYCESFDDALVMARKEIQAYLA